MKKLFSSLLSLMLVSGSVLAQSPITTFTNSFKMVEGAVSLDVWKSNMKDKKIEGNNTVIFVQPSNGDKLPTIEVVLINNATKNAIIRYDAAYKTDMLDAVKKRGYADGDKDGTFTHANYPVEIQFRKPPGNKGILQLVINRTS